MFKEEIVALKGYHPSQQACEVVLDANESYVNKPYNRYPDPTATALREWVAEDIGCQASEVIMGNGSSEMIDLIMKCTLRPGDTVFTFGPTFSIYGLNAAILGAKTEIMPLNQDFELDVEGFIKQMKTLAPKLIILCNPNNPTGTVVARDSLLKIVESTSAVVIVDEAYIEFGGESVVDQCNTYKNLIVLRTFSKAYGLAGARLGYMVANEKTTEIVNIVRPPYNLSALAQSVGLESVAKKDLMTKELAVIKAERQRISHTLKDLVEVYPSGGNFIFFKTDYEKLYDDLLEKSIRIRKYSGDLKGYYRVTVGERRENDRFLQEVKNIYDKA